MVNESVLRFTLDTNCLIDLEESRPGAVHVIELIEAHRAGRADVAVVTVTASERQKDGGFLDHFSEFEARLERLGMTELTQIQPIMHWDVSFYGYGYWADSAMIEKERAIHEVLHPGVPISYDEFCRATGVDPAERPRHPKWRNRLCDTQIVWSHIHHGRDILVTRDANFLKESKRSALAELGVKDICRPSEAAAHLGGRS